MFSSAVFIQPCTATVVWSDNFDDGNYIGWTVVEGSCTASNNYLELTYTFSMISHSSTTVTGTWSFDINSGMYVEFICVSHGTADAPENGYCLAGITGTGLRLYVFENGASTGLCYTSYPTTLPFHVDITRNSTGHFNIFIDGAYKVSAQDTTHTSSTYFVVHGQNGYTVDNIVVSNSIDIAPTDTGTSSTDTTTGIPGFPLASIALGTIAAVGTLILIRRRRH